MKKSFTQFIGGGKYSLVAIILFLIALLPSKSWAQSYNGASGVVLTYEVSDDQVTITGMTTAPSDGKLVIPSEIEGKAVTELDYSAFSWESAITSVEIPAPVLKIAAFAFYDCSNLSEISFAEGSQLNNIERYAFSGTNITNITIPENVANIGSQAFVNYAGISSVTILSKTPCTLGDNIFGFSFTDDFTIIVPAGCGETYKSDRKWSEFAKYIKESEPTSISHATASASATSAAIYTLDGRLASKDGNTQALAKGIYVQNGKKVVIGK